MQSIIEMWIAKGASEADARALAIMYGAPKRPDSFLARWNIHKSDWALVSRKAHVKRVVTSLEKAGIAIARIYISQAFGSVYIDLEDERVIRIADHARTSSEHAIPHYNIIDEASLCRTIKEICA